MSLPLFADAGAGSVAVGAICAATLFSIGIWGVLKARDVLRVLLSVTVILSSITLLAVTLAHAHTDAALAANAQAIVLLAWAVEVIEIVIALALFIALSRHNITELSRLREGRW